MGRIKVAVEWPDDILGVLDVTEHELGQRMKELVVMQLVREGRISRAKAAELLGVDRWTLLKLLAKYDIPYFDMSVDELKSELEVLKRVVRTQ